MSEASRSKVLTSLPSGERVGIAFSGVGVGSMLILPWLQTVILHEGWRAACWALGIVILVVLKPTVG